MKITSIGQATYYLEEGFLTVLTDPWFSTGGLSALFAPRLVPPAFQPEEIEDCKLILLSHIHLDHWDRHAAELAARCKSIIVTAEDAALRLRRSGLNAVGLKAGESWNGLEVSVRAVKAKHSLSPGALGLVLFAGKTVYFSGDTLDHEGLDELIDIPLDLALLQASCARYPFLGADGMDWPAAVSLAARIKPLHFIPMHFTCKGKYLDLENKVRIQEPEKVKEELFRRERAAIKEGIDCRVLWPGESMEI